MEKRRTKNTSRLSKDLLNILACPDDKAPVKEVALKGKYALKCTKCKRVFEVRTGIPIMLPKE